MKVLDAQDTQRALPFAMLVPAIARAAREFSNDQLLSPERLVVPAGDGSLLCMPAVASDLGVTKLITVHAANPARGLPAIQGEMIVFEAGTGKRLLVLDGATVTARRTAAVTLLGIETIARRTPRSAMLIGTGTQAWVHALALIEYMNVRRFWIAARELPRAQQFIARLRAIADIEATALAADAVPPEGLEAELIIALTTSKTPVVPARLPASTLVVGVGAFRPDMAELPPQLLQQRRIVVDYLHGARSEAGDLLQANVNWNDVIELSALLDAGTVPGDAAPVFKTVGHASWDLAAARVAVSSAP